MSKINEAVIVLAKCSKSHRAYGMRVEKLAKDQWRVTWAFPIKETTAKHEGYDRTTIKGNIEFLDEYPGCPYCGGKALTLCSCGHLNCTVMKNGIFTCAWCGSQGQLGDYRGEAISASVDI